MAKPDLAELRAMLDKVNRTARFYRKEPLDVVAECPDLIVAMHAALPWLLDLADAAQGYHDAGFAADEDAPVREMNYLDRIDALLADSGS